MIAVDASVWISCLLPQDVNHAISRRWIAARVVELEPMVVPNLVLVEVAAGVARRTERPLLGRQAVRALLRVPRLDVRVSDNVQALMAAACAWDLSLRGADAVYVALALQLGVPLLTWDQEQITRGGRMITVRQPTMA
jgi:predicted nucleic acid-binding protein